MTSEFQETRRYRIEKVSNGKKGNGREIERERERVCVCV